MKYCYSLFFLTLPLLIMSQKASVQFPAISKELKAMRGPDQAYRIKWIKLRQQGKEGTKKYQKVLTKLKEIDRSNTARMREIVAEIGWPTIPKVGKSASNTAWLMVQHADRRPHFQAQCLPLLKAAMVAGQIDADDYAYLYDRVQVAKGAKQLYATQTTTHSITKTPFFQAIEDETNVQQRREEMGIERPIEAYAEAMGFSYTLPTLAEADIRAQDNADAYTKAITKAREAEAAKDYQTAATAYLAASNSFGMMTATDYVATARTISLARHEAAGWAYTFLMKAILQGYDQADSFNIDPDFAYLRSEAPGNWEDLLAVVREAGE